MKRLILVTLLALAGCGGSRPELPAGNLAVPSYFCTQTPTGATRIDNRMTYCGKGCSRPQDFKQYAVEVNCKYVDWREE